MLRSDAAGGLQRLAEMGDAGMSRPSLLEELRNPDCARYEELPESIKAMFTETEFLWLPDESKATLVQRETEPDWTEP